MNKLKKEKLDGRGLLIYVPASYPDGDRHYPVLYVQDGGYLFQQSANWIEHLVLTGQLPEVIYVGVEPVNRNDDYTPWPAEALAAGGPSFGGKGSDYVDWLTGRVKPHIDSRYRTKPGPAHTGLIGGSFGGLISVYAAYLRPDVFGLIGSLSGSFWYERFVEFMRERPAPLDVRKLYMYAGDCEGIYKQNIQKHMVPRTHEARAILLDKGFPAADLKFVIGEGATHDQVFFVRQFPDAVRWLFGAPQAFGV